jgi:prepilin-type N-terminal cleavage/methylation domain-containing protein
MTGPRAARRARAGQRGVTLIELLVTIGVLAVGFVALLTAFAQTELAVGTTNADAILASRAAQVAGYIQSSGNFTYVQCTGPLGQSPGGVKSYLAQLFDQTSKVRISGAWTNRDRILSVAQASSGNHTVAGQEVPIAPRNCSLSGTGSSADYGIQQIVFQVVSPGGQTLTRTVYKRWN